MLHRKQRETKQQPSMLPSPAVSGCCLVSFCFLCDIHFIHSVSVNLLSMFFPGINAATTTGDGSACNTLTVPGFLGAIPRPQPPRRRRYQHASSTESDSASANTELSTPSGSTAAAAGASGGAEERRCFCGYYSEVGDPKRPQI